jgi:hypothetical protein
MALHVKTCFQQLDDDPFRKDRVEIIETLFNLPCQYFSGHPSEGIPPPQYDGEMVVIQWAITIARS